MEQPKKERKIAPGQMTLDQRKQIVEMKLQGYTHEEVAAAIPCTVRTARKWWYRYREGHEKDVQQELDSLAKQLTAQHSLRAAHCLRQAREMETLAREAEADPDRIGQASQFRREARGYEQLADAALKQVAKLSGAEAAAKLELTGADGGPLEIDFSTLTEEELKKYLS